MVYEEIMKKIMQVRFQEGGIQFKKTVLSSVNCDKNQVEISSDKFFVFVKDLNTDEEAAIPLTHVRQMDFYPNNEAK